MNQPMITDWIQAIGIFLGFPTMIWGIVTLFKKDKNKETQIKALTDLSKAQVEILNEMRNQIEFEKQKRKQDLKPYFVSNSRSTDQKNFEMKFRNQGAKAILSIINDIEPECLNIDTQSNLNRLYG